MEAPRKGLFGGMLADLKRRAPHYISDWVDGFHPKIIAATLFMYFTSIAPAITFSTVLDTATKVDGVSQIGAVEVLLSTAITGAIFSIFGGQPLCIVGVTGPVSIFTVTVFTMAKGLGVNFLPFYAWCQLWAALMHVVLAMTNCCTLISWVTRYSCETFGFLIAVIYLYTGIKDLVSYFGSDHTSSLLQLVLGLGTAWLAVTLTGARSWVIMRKWARNLVADYGATFAIIFFTAVPYMGKNADVDIEKLDVPEAFGTTSGRSWMVDLGALPAWAVFLAIIPGFILTVLFFFDHNVSSLLAQAPEFGLKKGTAYHWDFFVVGLQILLTGLLGIPPVNGLIPQAPLHTASLAEIDVVKQPDGKTREVITHVHEQRVSNLLQAALIGMMVSDPLLKVLGLIPKATLDGLFLYMGLASFPGNQFYERVMLQFTEPALRDSHHAYLDAVPFPVIRRYTAVQFALLVAIFLITLTPAAMLFPVLIAVLVPLRRQVFPRYYSPAHLAALDSGGEENTHGKDLEGEGEDAEAKAEMGGGEPFPAGEAAEAGGDTAGLRHRTSSSGVRGGGAGVVPVDGKLAAAGAPDGPGS
mmetsp:Transcript_28810/g.42716  ORF Transcript_28810/g.42716 Transcript_28810/m.42716 type:complete len:583 (+) Transcript_28810:100-1848(+)